MISGQYRGSSDGLKGLKGGCEGEAEAGVLSDRVNQKLGAPRTVLPKREPSSSWSVRHIIPRTFFVTASSPHYLSVSFWPLVRRVPSRRVGRRTSLMHVARARAQEFPRGDSNTGRLQSGAPSCNRNFARRACTRNPRIKVLLLVFVFFVSTYKRTFDRERMTQRPLPSCLSLRHCGTAYG
jgi:hypothetical protein